MTLRDDPAARRSAMAILLHGTTRRRGERIVARGPDPGFVEPGGALPAEGFSTCLESGPFPLGTPRDYACAKARQFRGEGGAVIVVVDVPDAIIAAAVDDTYFPLSQGVVQFDRGAGLEALCDAWPTLAKHLREVECP
jgi:hypothetical protein